MRQFVFGDHEKASTIGANKIMIGWLESVDENVFPQIVPGRFAFKLFILVIHPTAVGHGRDYIKVETFQLASVWPILELIGVEESKP